MHLLLLALFCVRAYAVLIPGPPGPFAVSRHIHDLTDEARQDPYAPANATHKRRIMATSYVPIDDCGENYNTTLLEYMPPQSTVAYGDYAAGNGLPDTLFQDIQLEFYQGSSVSSTGAKYPLVLFSPGLSSSRLLHSIQARALASYGYVVVTVDHPYDSTFVEFTDGSSVRGIVGFEDPDESDFATEVRAKDISFVLDLFYGSSYSSSQIPSEVVERADLSKTFVYGHSLGGATAAEVTLLDDRVLGGFDIDGSPWAQAKRNGLDKPFLMSGKGTANGIDETWAPFYEKLKGPKMQVRVEGATHYSYIDVPLILVARPLPEQYDEIVKYLVGTVEGKRMNEIVMSLLTDFAKLVLEGDSGPLRSLNETYSEITVVEENLSVE